MMKKTLLAVGVAASLVACGRIETGHIGVRTDFNKKIELDEVPPGWYGAVFTSVDDYIAKEIEVSMNNLKPKAKDNLSLADLDISIFYLATPNQVADMAIKYSGMSAQTESGYNLPAYNLVERYTRGSVYDTVSKYDSLTIHTKRGELEREIQELIQSDLDKSDPGAFKITKVIVRQLVTDPALEASIQQSVKVQKQIEAKRQEVELAQAEAERQKVEADGQATANKIIAQSITPELLQLRQIEALRKFAGEGTHTVIMPSDTKSLVTIK